MQRYLPFSDAFKLISPGKNGCHFANDIFIRIFENENLYILIKLHWILFPRFQLTITQCGLDNGFALNRRQAIIWTNADQLPWRIYAALGGDEVILVSTPFYIMCQITEIKSAVFIGPSIKLRVRTICWIKKHVWKYGCNIYHADRIE